MGRPSSIILLSENYRTLSEEYYTHHRKIGFTANSTRARQLAVNEFLSWLEWQGLLTIEKIETQHIIGYYNYISERPSKKNGGVLSQKSTFSQITSIKHLFSMLQSKGRMKNNPSNTLNFPYPKEQKEKEILIQSEIKLLYKVSISALERAILSLAYGCGLRVGELEQV
jgi:integrase/recombinase XerD